MSSGTNTNKRTSQSGVQLSRRKRARPNAWRSCQKCKDRKQRCELPASALLQDPSPTPLDPQNKCERCVLLDIPCILHDSDKLPRIILERRRKRHSQLTSRPESSQSSEKEENMNSDRTLEQHIALQQKESRSVEEVMPSRSQGLRTHPEELKEWKRYNLRSRPITLITELVVKQALFASHVPKFNTVPTLTIDIAMSDILCQQVSKWCIDYLVPWFPYLPSPWELRTLRRCSKDIPPHSRLLEAVQCIVAMQHGRAFASLQHREGILQCFCGVAQRQISRIFFTSSSRDLDSAQAFELLAAFPMTAGYLDRGDTQTESVDLGLFTHMARCISTACKNHYRQHRFIDAPDTLRRDDGEDSHLSDVWAKTGPFPIPMTEQEVRIGVQWCSACSWDFAFSMGNDDLCRTFPVEKLPTENDIHNMLQYMRRKYPQGITDTKGLGQVFALLRALNHASIQSIWSRLTTGTDGLDCDAQTKEVYDIIKQWENAASEIQALRSFWLENTTLVRANTLLHWLDAEASESYMLVSGAALFIIMQQGNEGYVRLFTPQLLFNLINGVGFTKSQQDFVFKIGDERLDAAEAMLLRLGYIADADDGAEVVVPTLCTCGYVMAGCMLAMETLATAAKYWNEMHRRSEAWMAAMRSARRLLIKLTDTSIEEGGFTPVCLRMINGMLDVINIWRKAVNQSKFLGGQSMSSFSPMSQSTGLTISPDTPSKKNTETSVGGIDISLPQMATDPSFSLDELLADVLGSTDWIDPLDVAKER